MAMAYMLYLLSCFYNPQLEYDLAPGSSIVFIQQSKTLMLAKKVCFDQFAERLRHSKYFTKQFMFDPQIKSELVFPKGIHVYPLGGGDTSALGMNVFGGTLDELNYMERVTGSAYTRYTGGEEYDQAERVYTSVVRRIKSRFMQKGKVPGKLLLVSSTNYPGDFTDRKMEEAKTDKTIFVMHYSQWAALPADRFSGERFLVEVGNDHKRSRVIANREEAIDGEDVIDVPEEFRTDFERDIDAALRDLAGIAASTKHPFIPHKESIVRAGVEHKKLTGGLSLFLQEEVVLNRLFPVDEGPPDWSRLVSDEYLEQVILDRTYVTALHVDVSLSGDAAG